MDAEDIGWYNFTDGLKAAPFRTIPNLFLLKNANINYLDDSSSFIYSNMEGEFVYEGINNKVKKGWNMIDSKNTIINDISIIYNEPKE